jgi:hypothetical protein
VVADHQPPAEVRRPLNQTKLHSYLGLPAIEILWLE